MSSAPHLTCEHLMELPNIRHGFFTREGGVSDGIYSSLNCGPGSDDTPEKVIENRSRAAQTLGQELHRLVTCYQVHSAVVQQVDEPWDSISAPEADAMVTKNPNIILGILTADCLPVLFADGKAGIIGAAHAGWKGAFHGVLENTVEAMEKLGANNNHIIATIGPGIAQASYEVGAEFRERFLAQTPDNEIYFIPGKREAHYLFGLKAYAMDRLRNIGLAHINLLERDTCFEEDAFFSFRRATLKGEPSYGRQISAITIEK
ncbi:MAG: peptidoglycan editing factor PgeF [Rickettsiales bacterium]